MFNRRKIKDLESEVEYLRDRLNAWTEHVNKIDIKIILLAQATGYEIRKIDPSYKAIKIKKGE